MSDSSIISISEDESPRSSRSASPDSPPAKKALIIPAFTALNQPKIRRCKECNVFLQNDVAAFEKNDFKNKYPNWQSETGGFALDGMKIEGSDELEDYLLEDFCLYDEEHHFIHLDSNFLKKDDKLVKKIYFSGNVQKIRETLFTFLATQCRTLCILTNYFSQKIRNYKKTKIEYFLFRCGFTLCQ